MSSPEEIMKEIAKTLDEFDECNTLAMNVDIAALPFELQIQLLKEHGKLLDAITSYNATLKRAIVVDAMMKEKGGK